MTKINISKLKNKSPLYIIGHKNPDVDTVFSSYLLSNVLNFLGVESYACVLEENYQLDSYNKKIIDDYLDYNPVVINCNEISQYNFILVDHNDPIQSLEKNNNIVLCIDHHQNANKIKNIILGNYCANCLFIYKLFKDIYCFSEKEKQLIMMATLTDTLFLKTNRYKDSDKVLVNELNLQIDNNKMLKKYFVPTDISCGIENYIKKSDRDFSFKGVTFGSSVIHLLKCDKSIISNYNNAVLNKEDNHLGILRDLGKGKTYVFLKINNNFKEFSYNYIVSRITILEDVRKYLKFIK